MSAVQFFLPYQTVAYNGIAQPGALFYFYTTGTTTLASVYSNSGLSIARTNPVVANGAGQLPTVYLDGTKIYRLVIKDKNGASLGVDIDPYIPGTIPDAAVLQPYVDSATAEAVAAASSAGTAATSATGAASSASAAATSASSAATSATNSANSATASAASATASAASATNSASSATGSAASLAAISAAILPGTLNNATVAAATRSILAGLGTTLPAYLTEAGREGTFKFSSSNLSAAVTADTQQGVYVAPASDTTGASGAWVRTGNVITPTMFGAVAKAGTNAGSVDSATALQALFTFWAANASYIMDWSGTYVVRSALTMSSANDLRIRGNLTIYADAAMDTLLTWTNLRHITMSGRLTLVGPGTNYATRTVGTALLMVGCFSNHIADLHIDTFKYYGINTTRASGSPANTIVHCHIANCGSGIDASAQSLTSTWNTPVNSGAVDGTQRTTINVGTMFPADYVTTHNAGIINDAQLLVRINGQYYQVYNYDAGAGTIGFLPWLDPADFATGSGTLTYVIGASDRWVGGDSDINLIDNLILQANGRGHTQCCLYGNMVSTMESVNSGVAVSLSAVYSGILWGFNIGECYTEGNNCDIMVAGALTYGTIGVYELEWSRVKYYPAPRATTGTSGDRYVNQNLAGITINYKGRALTYEKDRRGSISNRGTSVTVDQAYRKTVYSVSGSTSWFMPTPDAFAPYKNDLYGYNSCGIVVIGPSADGTPTGSQTFVPPTGYSINGGAVNASVVFPLAGFRGPAEFVVSLDYDALNYTIAQSGGPVGYVAGAGGAVTQGTSKGTGVTLAKMSGQITTHNASLAAGTSVSFTLSNSLILSTDVVVANISSGATAASYQIEVDNIVNTSTCRFHLRNVSAGALAEAIVINFVVIRGANS